MIDLLPDVERLAWYAALIGGVLAASALATVVVERMIFAFDIARKTRLEARYRPLVTRALQRDDAAERLLLASPIRHRLPIASLLIVPLIEDRDPVRIARTRELVRSLSIDVIADRYLRSPLWWRQAVALRALGLLQAKDRTGAIIAALDDRHPDVRAAALDALADLQDPASLQGIIVRMHDASLHRGRRVAALRSFGGQCEPFILELAEVDPAHRGNYARALAMCGTEQSRAALCRWTRDIRVDVRAAAFEALEHVGLDERCARRAIEALDTDAPPVRAMAAASLRGWTDPGDAAAHLARHLEDTWPVAVRAARSLESMGPGGMAELQARAGRPDLAGELARQMLWQEHARC